MDSSQFKRDPKAVLAVLRELPNGALATTKPLHIHVPETFRSKGILTMGEEVVTMGYINMLLETGEYGIYTAAAMLRINPTRTAMIEIDGTMYYDFFEAGTTVIKSLEVFKDDLLLYNLVDEQISRGRMAWYYGYEDLADYFVDIRYYTGTSLTTVRSAGEMIIAQSARLSTKNSEPLRYHLTKAGVNEMARMRFLPLRNVSVGAVGFTAKFMGSYMDDGIDSQLIADGGKSSALEEVLRA
jgi:hypothetical protein